MNRTTRARLVALFGLLVASLALAGVGLLRQQVAYQTRGLPSTLPEPVSHAGVTPGLNVYLNQYDDGELATTLAQIAATGVTLIKQPFYFKSDFDWAEADRLVTAVAAHDLQLVPLLDGDPANGFAPPDPDAFAAWSGAFAARYGADISHYIIWDEPNITTHWGNQPVNAAEYGALLTASGTAIRSADSDAVIIAAPLAPTIETGPENVADPLYLQQLYEEGAAGSFDIVMAKPYGFNTGPEDRDVDINVTNFSRIVLLREVMQRNGDDDKALWAGNWGWNALPPEWSGAPSIWGEATETEQADFVADALKRARQEWPWSGVLFLENWEPDAAADDPRWGFSTAGRETEAELSHYFAHDFSTVAWPGFHWASPDAPAQQFAGGWRFSPDFGADISQPADEGAPGDRVTFTFWGTDVGVRIRRANFRARFYVTVDGEPANALPVDENGAALVLTAPDPSADYITIETVARDLEPRQHELVIVASRGWDQWALQGFSVAFRPSPTVTTNLTLFLLALAAVGIAVTLLSSRQAQWGQLLLSGRRRFRSLDNLWQLLLTWGTAALVALGGWLTWSNQAEGVYRRLGDGGQLALTASAALVFYLSPSFIFTVAALFVLFILIYFRPAWGLALIALCFPFYVAPVLKPVFQFRFSPVEIFTLVTFAAFIANAVVHAVLRRSDRTQTKRPAFRVHPADYAALAFFLVATASLFFSERLDVASNEWRLVILEPLLFYALFRLIAPTAEELWAILDAFVLGGLLVALYGLWQFGFDRNSLITAEGGLLRLKSLYGSPNNVGLYLGRILPLLAAMALLGSANGRRRWLYTAALLPIGLAALLTFSKGAIFLGLPAACLFIFWQWQRQHGRRTWPWLLIFGLIAIAGLSLIQQIPTLAGRLGLFGETGIFRLNLWRAALNMVRENPLLGVGLDNFLYAYRGRFIFDGAWRDPNLNHPHNLLLDFASRLGLLGLVSGLALLSTLPYALWQCRGRMAAPWFPVWVGIGAAFIDMVVHGLVDHSFFLVDLAFAFFLMLATAVWLQQQRVLNANE